MSPEKLLTLLRNRLRKEDKFFKIKKPDYRDYNRMKCEFLEKKNDRSINLFTR